MMSLDSPSRAYGNQFRGSIRAITRAVCVGVVSLFATLAVNAADTTAWGSDVTNALQIAKSKQRPVLLEFNAPWCPYCKQMDNKTFKDADVMKSLEQFERVAVNIDHNAPLAAQHAIRGIPAFVILDPEGDELAKASGFMDAGAFNKWLADGSTNLTTSAALRQEFDGRTKEVAGALASADAETRARGLIMVLDCCERPEKIYRTFGQEKLHAIAQAEPGLLLEGLNHPGLMARIRAANLLRDKLGDAFNIDPWENADVRAKGVTVWKQRLAAKSDAAGK
jgi:thiol:disulfide interchange protein DsbD